MYDTSNKTLLPQIKNIEQLPRFERNLFSLFFVSDSVFLTFLINSGENSVDAKMCTKSIYLQQEQKFFEKIGVRKEKHLKQWRRYSYFEKYSSTTNYSSQVNILTQCFNSLHFHDHFDPQLVIRLLDLSNSPQIVSPPLLKILIRFVYIERTWKCYCYWEKRIVSNLKKMF